MNLTSICVARIASPLKHHSQVRHEDWYPQGFQPFHRVVRWTLWTGLLQLLLQPEREDPEW